MTMPSMRKTDKTQSRYRRTADRIVQRQERWFVRTREGLRGPFRSRREAHAEARLFVDTMIYLSDELDGSKMPGRLDLDDVTVVNMEHIPWG